MLDKNNDVAKNRKFMESNFFWPVVFLGKMKGALVWLTYGYFGTGRTGRSLTLQYEGSITSTFLIDSIKNHPERFKTHRPAFERFFYPDGSLIDKCPCKCLVEI